MSDFGITLEVKIVKQYLVVRCRDLGVHRTVGDLTQSAQVHLIGRTVLELLNQSMKQKKPEPKKDTLSIGEVARVLGVSVMTVRRLVHKGKLVAIITEGGHRRFRITDVERYEAT